METIGLPASLRSAWVEFRQAHRGLPLRQQCHALLYPTPSSGHLQFHVDRFLMFMVLLSVVLVVLETVTSIETRFHRQFLALDVFVVAVFTTEYLLRVYSAPENPAYGSPIRGRLRFMLSWPALIDLLAIAPFFLAPFIGQRVDLRFMRIFRLARIFKLARYTSSLKTLAMVFAREAPILAAAGFLMLLLVMVAASLGYLFEHEAQPDKFENIPQSIYWAVITLASVGYGDLSPVTPAGRLMTIILAIVGVGIFALPAGLLSSAFSDQLRLDRERFQRMVDEALADGVLTEDEKASIAQESKRLHLADTDVEYMMRNILRGRGMSGLKSEAGESVLATENIGAEHTPPSAAGDLLHWQQNPGLAFSQLNHLIGHAKLIVSAADPVRLQEMFADPTRSCEHDRAIFSLMLAQASDLRGPPTTGKVSEKPLPNSEQPRSPATP